MNHLLRVRDMSNESHDTCTSGTSQILTVALLQRLKMEAFIPAPADCEIRSMIVFECTEHTADRNSSWAVPGLWSHQHISCRSSAGKCLIIIHLIARTSRPVIYIFSCTSRNSCLLSASVFRMTERGGDECHTVVPIPGDRLLWHSVTKLDPTVW